MKAMIIISMVFTLTISCIDAPEEPRLTRSYTDLSEMSPRDTLIRIEQPKPNESEISYGYVNQKGDTIIPVGQYAYCPMDTVTTYVMVGDSSGFYAIDQEGNRLFEVYWFDNGPDYVQDGLFRMMRNGKIGFANTKGQIVIEPQFDCADPFENGKARVALDCENNKDGEHVINESDSWFYIDRSGNKLE